MTPKCTDAVELLTRRYVDHSPQCHLSLLIERVNADIASLIYDMRIQAGLTQAQLAQRIKTAQSVISRLEDADYTGHSLTMLLRIAVALGRSIDVRLTTEKPSEA